MDFSRNRVIIIVLLAITSIAIIIWGDYQSEAKRIKYFENFNLYLKGEILEIENTNSGSFKIIGIRVDSSNYEFMLPKESEDGFFYN